MYKHAAINNEKIQKTKQNPHGAKADSFSFLHLALGLFITGKITMLRECYIEPKILF